MNSDYSSTSRSDARDSQSTGGQPNVRTPRGPAASSFTWDDALSAFQMLLSIAVMVTAWKKEHSAKRAKPADAPPEEASPEVEDGDDEEPDDDVDAWDFFEVNPSNNGARHAE